MNKAQKTKETLSRSLIELLQRKPLDMITVKELTTKAKVGRTAFYNHFKNLDDILKYVYRNAHKEIFQDKYQNQYYQYSDEYLIDMIEFFDKNSDLLSALYKWNLIDIITKYNTDIVLGYVKDYEDEVIKNHPYYFICYSGVMIFNICILWLSEGKKESKEELFGLLKYFSNKDVQR